MSLPPRIFFDGRTICLEVVAGELSGDTDISSSSAFRFLDAMACCEATKESINLIQSFGVRQKKVLPPAVHFTAMARTQDTSGGNDEGYAYQKAAAGYERFRTEESKSGVAAIKGRSLFARTTGAKRVANQGADDKGDKQLLRDCRESPSQEMQSGGRSWNDKTKLGEWWENEELRAQRSKCHPRLPRSKLGQSGCDCGRKADQQESGTAPEATKKSPTARLGCVARGTKRRGVSNCKWQ